jgi:hypothetical protein
LHLPHFLLVIVIVVVVVHPINSFDMSVSLSFSLLKLDSDENFVLAPTPTNGAQRAQQYIIILYTSTHEQPRNQHYNNITSWRAVGDDERNNLTNQFLIRKIILNHFIISQ